MFPYIGNFIIPTDEVIFFRGVFPQAPTSLELQRQLTLLCQWACEDQDFASSPRLDGWDESFYRKGLVASSSGTKNGLRNLRVNLSSGYPLKANLVWLNCHPQPGTGRNNPVVISGWWFGCHFLFSHILGMSSSQLTHIFQRGGPTTNQICYKWTITTTSIFFFVNYQRLTMLWKIRNAFSKS